MTSKRTKLQERYELLDVLGRGGMGVVYRAHDTLMKREVALKTILDIDNPASAELFYKEWSILATMVHPNVIGIYDIGEFEEDGSSKPFFVMPMLPGVALDSLIRDGSPRLTTENVVNIIDQACRGLHAAHEQGLVHRDVKPSNIFPNVIGIYDIGEFEEDGNSKPFFVMPMLPGVALDQLIRDGSPRLTVENVVNIIDQACRGLHDR